MKHKSLILVGLFVIFGLIVTGCGGETPAPAEESQAPAPGFTPAQVCTVPDVVGLDQAVAEDMLVGLGLQPNKSVQHDASVAKDAVVSQNPPAGTRMEPCEGYITIVVSLGTVPQPTEPPTPTNTPAPPTLTPTPTPIPPTATPTPDPRLFWDDFENGIKSEWDLTGNSFFSVDGFLTLGENGLLESTIIGNEWQNYKIILTDFFVGKSEIRVRVQDRDNYMRLRCSDKSWGVCFWEKVVNGEVEEIPGTRTGGLDRGNIASCIIEVEGDIYRTHIVEMGGGEEDNRFVDSTFTSGGIMLSARGDLRIGDFQVVTLP